MTGEESQLIQPLVQWLAGVGFAGWFIGSMVGIVVKVRNNGNNKAPIGVHNQETHDTLLSVGRIESTMEVLKTEAVEQTKLLGKIVKKGKR